MAVRDGYLDDMMSTRHATTALFVALALSVVAAACQRQDNSTPQVEVQDRIIATALTTDDPSQVRVTWFPAPCESFDEVLVELDDDYANLRVRVTVDPATCPDQDITETVVDLGEPLGQRQIWDKAFNNTVALDSEPAS